MSILWRVVRGARGGLVRAGAVGAKGRACGHVDGKGRVGANGAVGEFAGGMGRYDGVRIGTTASFRSGGDIRVWWVVVIRSNPLDST